MATKIRVVVADDEAGYRKALSSVLANAPDIDLVGVAMNGREAFELVMEKDAEVLLTDIQMPTMSGLEAYVSWFKPNRLVPTLVMSMMSAPSTATTAFPA